MRGQTRTWAASKFSTLGVCHRLIIRIYSVVLLEGISQFKDIPSAYDAMGGHGHNCGLERRQGGSWSCHPCHFGFESQHGALPTGEFVPVFHFPFCSVTIVELRTLEGGSSYVPFRTSQTLLHGCCHHVNAMLSDRVANPRSNNEK